MNYSIQEFSNFSSYGHYKMKRISVFLFVAVIAVSCSVHGIGYTDQNGQYVPRWPRFKLKDKHDNVIPSSLDTNNIYKMFEVYEDGVKIYPGEGSVLSDRSAYIKFYPNGRCLAFSMDAKDDLGNSNHLKEENLNPNKEYYSKCYYYSSDGRNIRIENFVYRGATGMYIIINYFLSETGDTLIRHDVGTGIKFKKEVIPTDWKNIKLIGNGKAAWSASATFFILPVKLENKTPRLR